MLLASTAVLAGLVFLLWSANRFVDGSCATAAHFGISPLVIGIVVVGFGTSAPEMVVSTISAWQGNPGIALGNAYGSNIANIALILGITALVCPITVHSKVLRKELPILVLVTILAAWQLSDGRLGRVDAVVLLVLFTALIAWSLWQGRRAPNDTLGSEVAIELELHSIPFSNALSKLLTGLLVLVISSRVLVWGAVEIARTFGVSDLIIGLTVIAIGTSLPELAASVVAAKKREHDIALGNVIGSNLFNTMAVVGIAGVIDPSVVDPALLNRDIAVTAVLTASLFVFGYRRGGVGRINRWEGGCLLSAYFIYSGFLLATALSA